MRPVQVRTLTFENLFLLHFLTLWRFFLTGKGSFGKLIAEGTAGWAHLSLGEYMRTEITRNTDLGLAISSSMEGGRLVPDNLANDLAIKSLNEFQAKNTTAVILDGYPRTINQAVYFKGKFPLLDFSAVHIMLEKWVAIEKTLGRQSCKTCGGSFNSADIMTDGFCMPAIIPDKKTCSFGTNCNPILEKRADDTRETSEIRYNEFLTKTAPLLGWYEERGILKSFEVKRGIADVDKLIALMNKSV